MGNGSRKDKEPIVWKESEKEIELQGIEFSNRHNHLRLKRGMYSKRKRGMKILHSFFIQKIRTANKYR